MKPSQLDLSFCSSAGAAPAALSKRRAVQVQKWKGVGGTGRNSGPPILQWEMMFVQLNVLLLMLLFVSTGSVNTKRAHPRDLRRSASRKIRKNQQALGSSSKHSKPRNDKKENQDKIRTLVTCSESRKPFVSFSCFSFHWESTSLDRCFPIPVIIQCPSHSTALYLVSWLTDVRFLSVPLHWDERLQRSHK